MDYGQVVVDSGCNSVCPVALLQHQPNSVVVTPSLNDGPSIPIAAKLPLIVYADPGDTGADGKVGAVPVQPAAVCGIVVGYPAPVHDFIPVSVLYMFAKLPKETRSDLTLAFFAEAIL